MNQTAELNKYERMFERAKTTFGNASWIDCAIIPLAEDLEEVFEKPVKISGPYGWRAMVMLQCGDGFLTITPDFSTGHLHLYYDTGKELEVFAPGSAAAMNGMNREQKRLPFNLRDIVRLFKITRWS